MKFLKVAALGLMLAAPVQAQEMEWVWLPGMSTATLAASGWEITASSVVMRRENLIVLVSYWQSMIDGRRFTMQCFAEYEGSPSHTRVGFEQCMQPEPKLHLNR